MQASLTKWLSRRPLSRQRILQEKPGLLFFFEKYFYFLAQISFISENNMCLFACACANSALAESEFLTSEKLAGRSASKASPSAHHKFQRQTLLVGQPLVQQKTCVHHIAPCAFHTTAIRLQSHQIPDSRFQLGLHAVCIGRTWCISLSVNSQMHDLRTHTALGAACRPFPIWDHRSR